ANQAQQGALRIANSRDESSPLLSIVRLLAGWGEYEQCLQIAAKSQRGGSRSRPSARTSTNDLQNSVIERTVAEIGTKGKAEPSDRQFLSRAADLVEANIRRNPDQIHATASAPGPRALTAIAAAYVRIGDLD